MSKTKRIAIILLIFFGTPFLGLLSGWLISLKEEPYSDNRAFDVAAGVFLGILGAISSLILGVIVSYLARNKSPYRSMIGYYIPPVLLLIYTFSILLFL